jgi:O-antigen/teichoic acid export membrane protein
MNAAPAALVAPAAPPRPAQRRALLGPALRKGLLSVVDQAVVSGTSFFTSVLIGRLCSREDLGVYALALSMALFLRGAQGELVCAPYTIYSSRRHGPALAAYAGSALVHYLLLTALSTLALLGLAGLLSRGVGPAGAAPALGALAGALPFLLLRELVRQLANASLRLATMLAIDSAVAGLQLGGLLLLGRWQLLTVTTAYAVAGAACAAACLGWLLAGKQPLRVVPAQLGADWRHNWSFGRWALACFLVGSPMAYLLPWALALAHGEGAAGLLAACTTLINVSGMYVTGVTNFLTPRAARAFAEGGPRELRRVLGQTAALFAATLGAFCLLVFVAGDLPATLVYGNSYAGAASVLALLALNTLVNSLGVTAGNGLWALGRPQANFAADVATLVVTLGLVLGLVGPLGALGAALATLAGSSVGALVRALRLARLLEAARPGPTERDGGRA